MENLLIKLSAWRNCSDECMPDIVHKKWHNRCMNRLSEIYLLLLQFLCGKFTLREQREGYNPESAFAHSMIVVSFMRKQIGKRYGLLEPYCEVKSRSKLHA